MNSCERCATLQKNSLEKPLLLTILLYHWRFGWEGGGGVPDGHPMPNRDTIEFRVYYRFCMVNSLR